MAEWLREHAEGSGTVVSVCNGAQVLADAGLLDGRRATANWANMAEWERRYPDTEWVRGLRYVEDGNVLTAAGVTSGIGATLHVIRGYVGEEATTALAQKIGYPDQRVGDEPRIQADRLTASDRALYVLWGAYGWGKPRIGVVLTEGASEIELASVLRRLSRAGLDREHHLAYARRSPLAREVGARPLLRPPLRPRQRPALDRLLVPGMRRPFGDGPRVRSWAREKGLKLEFVHADAPRLGLPLRRDALGPGRHENAPVARFTARLLEYPIGHLGLSGGGWPFARLLRPLAVGLLGLVVVVALDRLVLTPWTKRLHLESEGTDAPLGAPAKARR